MNAWAGCAVGVELCVLCVFRQDAGKRGLPSCLHSSPRIQSLSKKAKSFGKKLTCFVATAEFLFNSRFSQEPSFVMSIFIGIAMLFGVVFALLSGVAGGGVSPRRQPHLTLRARADATQPNAKVNLLLEGAGFEPDSELCFVAWHLPDGHGLPRREPVASARPYQYRSSSFDDVAFEPAITLAPYAGEGAPHDIKVIATDNHGHSAEAWISGKEFYLKKESGVAA